MDRMNSEKELSQAFRFFDNNNDGLISSSDLAYSMEFIGEKLTKKQIDQMIKEADTDGDGYLNERGFFYWIFKK